MAITTPITSAHYVQPPRDDQVVLIWMEDLRNDLYCVEWDVKLYYTIPIWMNSLISVLTTKQAQHGVTVLIKMNSLPLCQVADPTLYQILTH